MEGHTKAWIVVGPELTWVPLTLLSACHSSKHASSDEDQHFRVWISDLIEAQMFDCCDCNQLAGTRAERNRVWSPEDLRIEMARGQAMPVARPYRQFKPSLSCWISGLFGWRPCLRELLSRHIDLVPAARKWTLRIDAWQSKSAWKLEKQS